MIRVPWRHCMPRSLSLLPHPHYLCEEAPQYHILVTEY